VAWFKYQATVNELTTLAKQRDDLVSRLEAARRNAEKRANAGRVTQMYAALRQSWQERSNTAAHLLSLLIGDKSSDNGAFKEWVYKEHIIPVIESQMNTFLEPLDNIRIRISHNAKSFMFMVRDRNHEATYHSSSGYQQFLVNLAIRQALANINSKGNNLKHMIIDEGFGACDANNILKARDMLNRLVVCGGFRSIILVSHLEALRDAIEIKIPVERVGVFASLKYGAPYPQPRMVTAEGEELPGKPTRGRARKNAA
jgi:DNA repair exonuclease SbcCD ATPase subunit